MVFDAANPRHDNNPACRGCHPGGTQPSGPHTRPPTHLNVADLLEDLALLPIAAGGTAELLQHGREHPAGHAGAEGIGAIDELPGEKGEKVGWARSLCPPCEHAPGRKGTPVLPLSWHVTQRRLDFWGKFATLQL